ncbi:DUF2357 domain-containing protein [Chitinophaga sp. S165]|uniref:DUF2357 domain-containing protein n=1 Tax=Chitinophaga sp. S165 TaxID=2135462 RepID=UPI000D82916E|nr:DUF2357 domain-containing protein [Chitinophaga sp. S165]PWV44849.1 hypothetical protein C7475_11712 [Chitinophaga sp. S165]
MNILAIDYKDFKLGFDLTSVAAGEIFADVFEATQKRHTKENFETAYLFSGYVKKFMIWQPGSQRSEKADIHMVRHPVFFENTVYKLRVDFDPNVVAVSFRSRVKNVKDLFDVRETQGGNLYASAELTFYNEPGEFDLIIDYELKTVQHSVLFQFTVFSAKLDSKKDHPAMVTQIETVFPRLVIDYLRKTYHHFGLQGTGDSDVLWWTIFGNIFRSIMRNLRLIVENPHREISVLRNRTKGDKIEKPKGPLVDKLAKSSGRAGEYFAVKDKQLGEDNYENRYVKHIIKDILESYERIYTKVSQDSSIKRMDKAYRMQLEFAGEAIATLPTHTVFRKVGKHHNGRRYSAVLLNHPGYVGLLKDWEALKMGYELQEGLYEIELKDIAYLYQLSCFFGIARLLQEITGVAPDIEKMPRIKTAAFRLLPEKNMHSKMVFTCKDGTHIELYQELRYTNSFDTEDAGTFDKPVCPDIILRIEKKDQPRNLYLTYLFDSKYRLVESDRFHMEDKMDEPDPKDVGKMREYRESIYRRKKEGQKYDLYKEVVGAYILFPGLEKKEYHERYYREVILPENIGGFPFLPGSEEGSSLLEKHLRYIIATDATQLLAKVPAQNGRDYMTTDAYVFVDPVDAADIAMYSELVENEAMIYSRKKLDQTLGDLKARYFAPYIEGRGIICFYEIVSINYMPYKKVYPPGHPLFRDEGRKYMVLKLRKKEMLEGYVQIKGMAGNRRFTQIKHLYSPKEGFIKTVTEEDVRWPDRSEDPSAS